MSITNGRPNADHGTAGAIIVKEALVKAQPAANAATLQTCHTSSSTVVGLGSRRSGQGHHAQKWVKLETAAGEGYVPEEHVRSPLEYRACFVKAARAGA